MKQLIVSILFISSLNAYADCDLSRPEIREMVKSHLQTSVSGDFNKAYWLNSIKSEKYSVFSVQFKTQDPTSKQNQVTTHMISVSCLNDGSPFIDSDLAWSIPFDSLHSLD